VSKVRLVITGGLVVLAGLTMAGCEPLPFTGWESFLAWATGGMVEEVLTRLGEMILSTPYMCADRGLVQVYGVMRTLAEATLVLAVVWGGLRVVLGLSASSPAHLVGQVLVAVLAMRLTPWLVDQFIWVANSLVGVVMAAVGGVGVLVRLSEGPHGSGLLYIVFWAIVVVLAVQLTIAYYVRLFEIMFLVATSPIMWVAAVGNRDVAGLWVKELGVLLITPLAHSITLLLLTAVTIGAAGSGGGLHETMLAAAALLFMSRTPAWLRRWVHQSPSPLGAVRDIVRAARLVSNPATALKVRGIR